MQAACDNNHIGYDQYQRNTLYTQAEKVGFDISKVTTDCETDCSALVRVCCASAGILGLPADFRTGNMPSNLKKTGQFDELTDEKYTKQSTYLRRGDILVTKTNGHTVVVLSNGSKAGKTPAPTPAPAGLSYGDKGTAVKEMQELLLKWNPDCLPECSSDGDFGSETKAAVKAFQKEFKLTANGVYDDATKAALVAFVIPAPALTYDLYTVQKGDSLWKIAKDKLGKGSRYPEIKKLNDMTTDIIFEGEVLKVPKG